MDTRQRHLQTISARRVIAIIAMLAVATFVVPLDLASAATPDTICTATNFSVRAPGLLRANHRVAGTLCGKDPENKQILLITAHGATYNHLYWDWPQSPDTYSFVRNQDASVSVLNIDLIGSGGSSHPPSILVTQQAQAFMLHQLIATMRGRGFENIILVGHSSGSGLVTLEAATYHDVDGVIVTGFLHRFALPLGGLIVPLSLYPAVLEPGFAGLGLDVGYLTTRPGARSNPAFYNVAAADPGVIAFDDAHKDVVPVAHAVGFGLIVNNPSISRAVNVPVLSLQGNFDAGFCDSPACPQAAAEPAAWSSAAQLELHVILGAGHNIHLHEAAAATEFALVREWLDRRFD